MKALDRFLQRWRIAKVRPFIAAGTRVLDIGCGDGALFEQLGGQISAGIGVDPTLSAARETERYRLLPGSFPAALPDTEPFDAITLLAVLEHIPARQQKMFAADCARRLKNGGVLLITVPSPLVDKILAVLRFLRLIDGMSLEEHFGFDPRQTPAIFAVPDLRLMKSARFQLGLNHLFVFQKTGDPKCPMEHPDLKQTESKEIAFFDNYYENEPYNRVGWRLRLAREVRSLRKEMRGETLGRVLSLGCGDGQFELMLAPWAQQVVGLDISSQGIEIARCQAVRRGLTNVEFRCLSFSDLRWGDQFDTIICLAFLHHVPEKELPKLLKQCFSHLKPGGFFYSQDPNRNGVVRKMGRVLMGSNYDNYHSPDERELDPRELESELKSAGFGAVSLRYIDLTLIPALFILAKKPGWPLRLCVPFDYLWCHSPLARWASGFVAVARKSARPACHLAES